MKIRIVEKKEDAKEMTIEELANCGKFIGFEREVGEGGSEKYAMIKWAMYIFAGASMARGGTETSNECWNGMCSLKSLLRCVCCKGSLHIFDTAQELYKWMSE